MTTLQELQAKAVITCVQYHDILDLTLPVNACHFESITVVTTPEDTKTQEVVDKIPNATCHLTNAFYSHSREFFNKGASIEEGFHATGRDGWILALDADIVLPEKTEMLNLNEQKIYGANRRILADPALFADGLFREAEEWQKLPLIISPHPIGFFQLFNSNAKAMKSHPWYPVEWQTAGWSDMVFSGKWDTQNQTLLLDFQVLHLGPVRQNWLGRTTQFLNGDFPKNRKKKNTPLYRLIEWLTFQK